MDDGRTLVSIPRIAVGRRHGPTTAAAQPDALRAVMATARRLYGRVGILAGDRVSAAWLARSETPYAEELRQVAAGLGRRGAILLNLSYEWGCTTGAVDDREHGGPTMLRVLDWHFDGLGTALVAAEAEGDAGPYLSLTWPGYVGVLTALAPGRFAGAINQPPLPATGLGRGVDWLAARHAVWRSTALPPAHLLRLAFDRCRTYAEAVRLLETTPICSPALFSLCGTEPGQSCVIERTERAARTRRGAVANHWSPDFGRGRPRGDDSHGRHEQMEAILAAGATWDHSWLAPPILNRCTKVVAMFHPRTGAAIVTGWEHGRQVTAPLRVPARSLEATAG